MIDLTWFNSFELLMVYWINGFNNEVAVNQPKYLIDSLGSCASFSGSEYLKLFSNSITVYNHEQD